MLASAVFLIHQKKNRTWQIAAHKHTLTGCLYGSRDAGVIKVRTAGTDGRRHISETTFLQAHFVKCFKLVLK